MSCMISTRNKQKFYIQEVEGIFFQSICSFKMVFSETKRTVTGNVRKIKISVSTDDDDGGR